MRHTAVLSGTQHVVLAVHPYGAMSFYLCILCLQSTVECADLVWSKLLSVICNGSMPTLKLRVSHPYLKVTVKPPHLLF